MPIGGKVVEALWEYLQVRETRSPSKAAMTSLSGPFHDRSTT